MTYIPRSVLVPVGLDARLAGLSTKFLWHCDGTNGQQSGIDGSLYHLPISFPATSGAQITTADFKFGTSCLALDGGNDKAAYVSNSSRRITFADKDFTIECWFKLSATDYGYEPIWSSRVAPSAGMVLLHTGGATPDVRWYFSKNSAGVLSYLDLPGGTNITRNVWNHIALCRDNYFLLLYLNFVLVNTLTLNPVDALDDTDDLWIGGDQFASVWAGTPKTFHGNIDEFRVTCGKNMYPGGLYAGNVPTTITYSAPTQAYTDPVMPASGVTGTMKSDGINGMYVQSPGGVVWTRVEDVSVDPRYPRKPTL